MTGTADRVDVLHVDDEPEFADLTAEFLERVDEGLVVHTATHPDDGIDLLAAHDIDCVVSDYDMPGWTGIEFLEAVRDRYSDLPFILYTGKGSEEVASDAISAGVTDYLQKGTGSDQYDLLANRIRNAVSARRATVDAAQRRHRLEQIVKTVPSCVVQLDHEGRFVFANDRAVEVLGLTESDLTDRTYNDPDWNIIDTDGDPIPEAELPFRRVRDTGEPLYDFRYIIEWSDGMRKVLSVNGAPLFDADGGVESVVFSISDITDRVQRERELERTTNRLEAVFENSPEMIDIHSGDGTVIDVNRRYCELFGRPKSELVGRKVWEIDHGIERADMREIWTGMDVGDRFEAETEFEREDGTRFPVTVHFTRLPDGDDGERFMVISRDITDRTERERELRRYRRMVNAMREVACIYDEAGRYAVVNERLAELYGRTPEAMVGEHSDFLAAIRERAEGDPFRELFDGVREELRGEFEGDFGALGPAVAEYRLTPMVVDGEVAGVVSVVRDVTDRRRREEEVEQARAEYEQLIDGMNDTAWVVDTDGSFLKVNDAAVELTGYSRSELLSMRIHDIDPTLEDDHLAPPGVDLSDGGTQVFETVHQTKDGTRIPVELNTSLVSYRGRTAALSIARDISERKHRERRMEEFVSMVSHDLRNPLNVARGRVGLAAAEHPSEHLDRAEEAHARIEELIDDLLALAREGPDANDPEQIDLDSFVRACWRSVATADATLQVDCGRTILADRSRFRQFLENLIGNSVEHGSTGSRTESDDAIEHSSTGSRSGPHGNSVEHGSTSKRTESDDAVDHGGSAVTVTVGELDDGTGFYIADDGVGIPADRRDEVFEVGHSTRPDGTGFGLSIVAQVVEEHGWEIRLTDGADGGARFEITGVEFVD